MRLADENCFRKYDSHHCCGCRGSFIHQKFMNINEPDTSKTDSSDGDD